MNVFLNTLITAILPVLWGNSTNSNFGVKHGDNVHINIQISNEVEKIYLNLSKVLIQ